MYVAIGGGAKIDQRVGLIDPVLAGADEEVGNAVVIEVCPSNARELPFIWIS